MLLSERRFGTLLKNIMMNNQIFVVSRDASPDAVLEKINQGLRPICPVCKGEILVARRKGDGKAKGAVSSLRCRSSDSHFFIHFLFIEDARRLESILEEKKQRDA